MLTNVGKHEAQPNKKPEWLTRALKLEWLGQTAASLLWITSVFIYGISATGDWFQLFAACAWLIANIAALGTPETSEK